MIVKTTILDFMIASGLTPKKMVLPKDQWESLLLQLSQIQRFDIEDGPLKQPTEVYEGTLFYRDIEIQKEAGDE